jgi:DNA repair photolyase
MFLPQNRRPREDWGKWIQAKVNAVERARAEAPRVAGKAVYLSSVTDPYVPADRGLLLTRGVLEALAPHQPCLLVQTRGPLVARDIDVLVRFAAVRVHVSIPTDSEEVRQAFEPKAPPLDRRWQALADLKSSGLPVGVCVAPMLPLCDPESFAERIAALAPGGRIGMRSAMVLLVERLARLARLPAEQQRRVGENWRWQWPTSTGLTWGGKPMRPVWRPTWRS